jgi:hypothetical protein
MWYSNNNNGGKMKPIEEMILANRLERQVNKAKKENIWEEAMKQLELPLWEDEDIESEDYVAMINKNGKIKMEEE